MTAEQDLNLPQPRRGLGTRMILGLLLLAFIGGALLMAWLSQNWRTLSGAQPLATVPMNGSDLVQNSSGGTDGNAAAPLSPANPVPVDAQTARIAELEQRLTRISVSAQAASYNANRAEALLTAFAVRRALDAGRPLGYIEGTLRLRFGDAQPKAVATIVNAAREPVTLEDLRLGLQEINAVMRDQRRGAGNWWQGFWREVGSLAIIRKAGAPSPEPEQRLARARHDVELGRIDHAMADLTPLLPSPKVVVWLELARRYNEAHRALDVIEAAAILEPRSAPGLTAPQLVVPDADTDAGNISDAAPGKRPESARP